MSPVQTALRFLVVSRTLCSRSRFSSKASLTFSHGRASSVFSSPDQTSAVFIFWEVSQVDIRSWIGALKSIFTWCFCMNEPWSMNSGGRTTMEVHEGEYCYTGVNSSPRCREEGSLAGRLASSASSTCSLADRWRKNGILVCLDTEIINKTALIVITQ